MICVEGVGQEVNRDRPSDIARVLMGLEQEGHPIVTESETIVVVPKQGFKSDGAV